MYYGRSRNRTYDRTGTYTATLTAVPDAGYDFTGWSEDASDSSVSIIVTMTEDKIVTANFIPGQANTIILIGTFPDHTIRSCNHEQVYGTSAFNQITLES